MESVGGMRFGRGAHVHMHTDATILENAPKYCMPPQILGQQGKVLWWRPQRHKGRLVDELDGFVVAGVAHLAEHGALVHGWGEGGAAPLGAHAIWGGKRSPCGRERDGSRVGRGMLISELSGVVDRPSLRDFSFFF